MVSQLPLSDPTSFSFLLSQVFLPNKHFALLTPSQSLLLRGPADSSPLSLSKVNPFR